MWRTSPTRRGAAAADTCMPQTTAKTMVNTTLTPAGQDALDAYALAGQNADRRASNA